MRLGALFISICMLLIAASAGATVHLGLGFADVGVDHRHAGGPDRTGPLQHRFPPRPGVRAGRRQPAERPVRAAMPTSPAKWPKWAGGFAALEGRIDTPRPAPGRSTDPLTVEIGELGTLVKQLADTVAAPDATGLARLAQAAAAIPCRSAAADTRHPLLIR